MNLHRLIFQNNYIKFILSFFLILFFCINAQSEIPEKYKIESSLKKCKGNDYKKWTNCYGEYKFPRVEYHGEWLKGNFHGKGVLKEAWGGIYVGDFKNNLANGYGRQEETDGTWWEGEVKNDKLHGKAKYYSATSKCLSEGNYKDYNLDGEGKYICDNGYKEIGTFKNDKLNGYGTKTYSNGTINKGFFKDGELNGDGEVLYYSGAYEKGNYVDNMLNGKGIYINSKGVKYEGEFLNDEFHGKGTRTWPNGTTYTGDFVKDSITGSGKLLEFDDDGNFKSEFVGEFLDGELHGKGTSKWYDGQIYTGEYRRGLRHGKGELLDNDGSKYIGLFKNGFADGFGVKTWAEGDKYEGEWIDGWRTGKGKYSWKSGSTYEGEFFEGKLQGNGFLKYSSGDTYKGEFFDDNENGEGIFTYINGDIFTGQFKDGVVHGKGKIVYNSGEVYEGLWENGEQAKGKKTLAKFTTDEKYYALIIGNNDYEKLEDLDNAVNDAKDLEKVLKEKYGFETTLLLNQKSDETVDAIIEFTQNRKKTDNILIFYAGHGQLVKKQKRGYWLPVDAGQRQDSKWLSNNNIKDLIASSDAKHILLIIDSCFSGSLMRGSADNRSLEKLSKSTLERLKSKKTRLVITSGGNEQVVDGIGSSKNSVFADPLIKMLKNNNDVIRSIELFQEVQNYVINNADQTPNHSLIHGTGHDGGEFLFFPKG